MVYFRGVYFVVAFEEIGGLHCYSTLGFRERREKIEGLLMASTFCLGDGKICQFWGNIFKIYHNEYNTKLIKKLYILI